jgi:hypothetical protein
LGRGFGEKLRTGEANGGEKEPATERISEIAGQGLTTLTSQAAHDAIVAKSAVDDAVAKASAEASKVVTEAAKVKEAAVTAAQSQAAATIAKVSRRDGTVKQWAKWMADQLRQVPDIKSYGQVRLKDLAEKGPAAAKGMWATAREALVQDYGNLTVEELLTQFAGLQK